MPDPSAIVEGVIQSILFGPFLGGKNIYLIDAYQPGQGALASATTGITPSDGGSGVVIPIGATYWQDSVGVFVAGPDCATLAAVAGLARTILHELVHLSTFELGTEQLAEDCLTCWAIQNMAATSFLWALAQRYPDLQGQACLTVQDLYFMSSQPDGNPCQGVAFAFDAQEQNSWAPGTPC